MVTAYIGMGANLASPAGPPDSTLAAAAAGLERLGCVVARSSLYSTAPVGLRDQPRFTNGVVGLETSLPPQSLLDALLDLERAFGRNRPATVPKGPRTLDLDILLIGDTVLRGPSLEIPHPRLAERAFVLVPLSQIAPRALDPRSGKTIAQLLAALEKNDRDAVHEMVPISCGAWTAGSSRPRLRPGEPAGAATGQPHDHRHR